MRNIIQNPLSSKYFILLTLLSGAALYFTPAAHADCTVTTSSNISVPNLVVQRDAPVGSQIGSEVVGSAVTFYTCATVFTSPSINWGVKSHGSYVMTVNARRIYSTNIAGIGYALGIEDTSYCAGTSGYITGNSDQLMLCQKQMGTFATYTASGKARLTFYKTAQTTGSGTVNSATIGASILNDAGTWRAESALAMNSFNVSTTACSVTNASIKVPLGNVLSTQFTGVGSTAAEKNFTIDLDCNAATRVNLTLEGAHDASGVAGALALTPSTSGATASGVAVQVLYNSSPVTFGTMFNTTTTATKGTYSIPLKAQYYQTATKITGGHADSVATFTLTYQ